MNESDIKLKKKENEYLREIFINGYSIKGNY